MQGQFLVQTQSFMLYGVRSRKAEKVLRYIFVECYEGNRQKEEESSLTRLRKDNEVKLEDEIIKVCNE